MALLTLLILLSLSLMMTPSQARLGFHSMAALQASQSMHILDGLGPTQCHSLPGLTESQRTWCRYHHVFMRPIAQGTRLGLNECSRQFRYQRWNCPVNDSRAIETALNLRTAETAFLQSIQSAGIMQAIARTCSRGNVSAWCSCDDSPGYRTGVTGHSQGASSIAVDPNNPRSDNTGGNFVWGGCGDNVDTGYNYGKAFLGDDKKFSAADAAGGVISAELMSQQNHEAGRQAVKTTIRRTCKCIGLTGSCTKKICWRSLPTIQVVGEVLMEGYRNARQVKLKSKKNGPKLLPLDKDEGGNSKVVPEELTYTIPSPNFCRRNLTSGVEGTRGRECNELSNGDDGCELLCCGRGYYAKRTVKFEKCRCRFFWCCKVVCDECISASETFLCN